MFFYCFILVAKFWGLFFKRWAGTGSKPLTGVIRGMYGGTICGIAISLGFFVLFIGIIFTGYVWVPHVTSLDLL